MRIEPGQHARDRLADQLFVIDRLDIVALDRVEHVGQLANFFERNRRPRIAECISRNAETDREAGNGAGGNQAEVAHATAHLTSGDNAGLFPASRGWGLTGTELCSLPCNVLPRFAFACLTLPCRTPGERIDSVAPALHF